MLIGFILGVARLLAPVLAAVVEPRADFAALERPGEPARQRRLCLVEQGLDGLAVVEGFPLINSLFAKHLLY